MTPPGLAADTRWPIDGRAAFDAALRDAFDTIGRDRPAVVRLCDHDFADWPLGHPAVIDALTRWAGPHRQLVVIARSFDALARRHPRWVSWRRTWSHLVSCRTPADDTGVDPWPTLLVAPGTVALALIDREQLRGQVSTRAADQAACTERIDALLQRSVDAFPATTLGL